MKVAPKYYNLHSKGEVTNTPLPSKTIIAPRKINPPTVACRNKVILHRPVLPQHFTTKQNLQNISISHSLDYNVIDELKKTKANISLFDICTLRSRERLFLTRLNLHPLNKKQQ
jgi:hypothetical protein